MRNYYAACQRLAVIHLQRVIDGTTTMTTGYYHTTERSGDPETARTTRRCPLRASCVDLASCCDGWPPANSRELVQIFCLLQIHSSACLGTNSYYPIYIRSDRVVSFSAGYSQNHSR